MLSGENHRQLYIPAGFAHGFCVLSTSADFYYKCTDFYAPGDEYGLRWDDSRLAIAWPITTPRLSERGRLVSDSGYRSTGAPALFWS